MFLREGWSCLPACSTAVPAKQAHCSICKKKKISCYIPAEGNWPCAKWEQKKKPARLKAVGCHAPEVFTALLQPDLTPGQICHKSPLYVCCNHRARKALIYFWTSLSKVMKEGRDGSLCGSGYAKHHRSSSTGRWHWHQQQLFQIAPLPVQC